MTYLTRTEATALEFIAGYIDDTGGISPSYNEIQQALGLSTKSRIGWLLDDLEHKGKLRRLGRRARAIELIDETAPRPKPVVYYRNAAYFRWNDETKELAPWPPK